ncbi:MAG: Ig-like domain-containing protein [Lachnospiraceae bacterium]|nr:Ig-like domain-containing protein [Lachnospiraceae bacterium]
MSRKKLALKAGKQKKIKAKLKFEKKVKNHRKVAWESDDESVATVTKGRIKAVSRGTCSVYAYAQNGVCAKVKVTVK